MSQARPEVYVYNNIARPLAAPSAVNVASCGARPRPAATYPFSGHFRLRPRPVSSKKIYMYMYRYIVSYAPRTLTTASLNVHKT